MTQVASLAGRARDALARAARFSFERGVEAAREAAIEHQRLDHVPRNVGPPEDAQHARPGTAAASSAEHEHELAGGDLDAAGASAARRPERQATGCGSARRATVA